MINPSLESYDSPLNRAPTLPSVRSPSVTGPSGKVISILDFGPYGNFGLSARPLARPRLGANAHIQRPHYLLSSETLLQTTFDYWRWSYGLMSGARLWDETWAMMIDSIQITPIF